MFQVGLGDVEQIGRVLEVGWDMERTWFQLLSCTFVAHSVLIWKAESDREKRQEPQLIFRLNLQIDTSRYIY